MPTFETLRQQSDERGLVRKIQKAVGLLAPIDVELPTAVTDPDSLPIDLKASGFWPVGLVSPDGWVFGREVEKANIDALGYASPIRSDVTSVARSVSMTRLQTGMRKLLELELGADYSGVVQGANGEVVLDEPELPVDREYRLIVLGTDGPAADNWILGKGFGRVQVQSTGEETWGSEGAASRELTLDIFTDDEIGTPVRHYFGGTGAVKYRDVLGFAQEAPAAWAASTAYEVGDRVTVSGGVLSATVAGTSGATEPALPASVGGTVVDGGVTWERVS